MLQHRLVVQGDGINTPKIPLFWLSSRGSGYEPKEYPGCTFWVSGHVEFNEATDEKGGCNLGAKNGQCVCAVTRKSK